VNKLQADITALKLEQFFMQNVI